MIGVRVVGLTLRRLVQHVLTDPQGIAGFALAVVDHAVVADDLGRCGQALNSARPNGVVHGVHIGGDDPGQGEVVHETTHVARAHDRIDLLFRLEDLLLHLFATRGLHQVLIFARTKHGADALSRHLEKAGIKSAALHGNKSQGARTRALGDFKDGKLVALVATDIAARGLDIDSLPHVINFEIPNIPEDYVHRIGRTGRAGLEGEALSLVSHDERAFLRDIEKLIRRDLERVSVPGFEPAPHAVPRPVPPPRGPRKQTAPAKPQSQKMGQKSGRPQQHHSGSRHR